jgi:hypothetical protein
MNKEINSITIYPVDDNTYEVHLGSRVNDQPQGVYAYTGDTYSLLQLAQISEKVFPKHKIESHVTDLQGSVAEFDLKLIRKASMEEDIQLDFGKEMILFAGTRETDAEKALAAANLISKSFYERVGLETECYKIGRVHPNFKIMRNENFDQLLSESVPVNNKGLVLLTATNVCRRCRRELKSFNSLAAHYPNVDFALVNLSSPQFKFYDRVFGDMGDGDPDEFRKTAAGVTPFVIVYVPNGDGILEYKEYFASGKAENPPHLEETEEFLNKFFA